jgi:hypothetical protein
MELKFHYCSQELDTDSRPEAGNPGNTSHPVSLWSILQAYYPFTYYALLSQVLWSL